MVDVKETRLLYRTAQRNPLDRPFPVTFPWATGTRVGHCACGILVSQSLVEAGQVEASELPGSALSIIGEAM